MTDLIPSPSLHTWIPGELITKDSLNANIRDVQKFLAYPPVTIVTRSAAQSIPNTTNTAVIFDTEYADVDGMFNAPSANLTVQRPGVYAIQFQPHFAPNAVGMRQGQIELNGTPVAATAMPYASPHDTFLNVSAVVACNTGDLIQGFVYQSSGAALNSGNQPSYGAPRMTVRLLSTAAIDVAAPINGTTAAPPAPTSSTPPSKTPTKHTVTFAATWSRSYNGSGNNISRAECYQGGDSPHTYNGNSRSLFGFNYNSIKSTLAGATNVSATLTFKVAHTWNNSGSPFYVTGHNLASAPATWGGASLLGHTPTIPAGRVYTYSLSSAAATRFQQGTYKGLGFGPAPSTSLSYYGYTYGAGQSGAPYLTFTYWK